MSAEPYHSPTLEARRAQMFPVLADEEIARLRRFGAPRRYADGECLFETGKTSPGMFVVLSGTLRITGRDGHGHDLLIAELSAGGFSGEIGQLSGRRALADGVAAGAVEALLVVPEQLRALLVAEAALGEEIMRALILRRVGLIEMGAGGPVLIGAPSSPGMARLRNFLARNGIPHLVFDPASDPDAHAFIERYAPRPEDMPLVACPDGSVLRNPGENELARCIGMLDAADAERVHDVAVVGAGRAGLGTAVYAASEGLSVLVVDALSFGGQAGASARIENYLGFPTGISGQALAGRAYTQAQKFGAQMIIAKGAKRLVCDRKPYAIEMDGDTRVPARTIIIATGAEYRVPTIQNLSEFKGVGVYYGATFMEAQLCRGEEVVVMGGGNSAGQAAVFLAQTAKRVHMLVRGSGLAESMSRYLIRRIEQNPAIVLRTNTEIVALEGSNHLERVRWRNDQTGSIETHDIRHVFVMTGAVPSTDWLVGCVALDAKGFIKTGPDLSQDDLAAASWPLATPPHLLETSLPGVFAVGDVRGGNTKRVASAVGEGSIAISFVHQVLSE